MFTLLVHLPIQRFLISTTVRTTRVWTMPLASIESMVTHATAQSVSQEYFVKRVRYSFCTRYECMETSRWWLEFFHETFFTYSSEMCLDLLNRRHNYLFHWKKKKSGKKSPLVCRAHALTIKKCTFFRYQLLHEYDMSKQRDLFRSNRWLYMLVYAWIHWNVLWNKWDLFSK